MARARSGGGSARANGNGESRRRDTRALTLVRVESAGRNSLSLVFTGDGEERSWKLEQTTVTEFLALLLRGRMRQGRRVMLQDVEFTLEPPETGETDLSVCLAMGPLELCAPMDRAGAKALKADIERSLRR